MKLLIIFGPPAVGKLTAAQQIESRTDFKLFHNHAVMDGIMHIFGKGTPVEDRLSRIVRENVIQEAANEGINLIFTYVWNFSREKGKNNIDRYKEVYEEKGGRVYFVELTAPLEIRTQRAASITRHDQKPHTAGAREVVTLENAQKFESPEPFFYSRTNKCLQIDASDRTPEQIATEIVNWMNEK